MSFFQEFKTFILRGNVIDLAIGIIIGGAFGRIVTSLVGDILMPPLSVLISGMNVDSLALTLKDSVGDNPAVVLKYGSFLQASIDFLIVGFVIFLAIKAINRIHAPKAADAPPSQCPRCLMAIPSNAKRCGHCCVDIP